MEATVNEPPTDTDPPAVRDPDVKIGPAELMAPLVETDKDVNAPRWMDNA
jgi:hypothetical protein